MGKRNLAFTKLASAKSPYDIVFDKDLLDCKKQVNAEVNRVRQEHRPIDIGPVELWVVDSSYSVNGTLAWELNNNSRKTALVLNTKTRHGSIRGVLVDLLKQRMPPRWGIGGHSGFAGFSLPLIDSEDPNERKSILDGQLRDFTNDLRKCFIK